jgi:hypothetical protein
MTKEIQLTENLTEGLSGSGPGDIKLLFYKKKNQREISENHSLNLKKCFLCG